MSTKRKRGLTLNSQARELVVKVNDYFERELHLDHSLLASTHVSNALGIGKRTVSKIVTEKYGQSGIEENKLSSPKRRKKSKPVTGIDHFDADQIRSHVYSFFMSGEYPTVNKLMTSLANDGLYAGGKQSLRTILQNIGFQFKKVNKRKILMERFDVFYERVKFLRELLQIDWTNVVFVDEMCLNMKHILSWTNKASGHSGQNTHLILCHAGSSRGFIPNSFFCQSKSTEDKEMDPVTFKSWFVTLLQNLPSNCTIVMDDAPHHLVEVDKPPTQMNKKADLVLWLERYGVPVDTNITRAELLNLIKENQPVKPRYVIDELAEEHGHKVLRIPPYHGQYNAIELIWGQIKDYATQRIFAVANMEDLLMDACANVTEEDWADAAAKTKKIMSDDYNRDLQFDNLIENEIIVDDETSSDSE